jgi:hypothetical protein
MSIQNEYWTVYGPWGAMPLSYDNEEMALAIAKESVNDWAPIVRVIKSTLVAEFRLEDENPTE